MSWDQRESEESLKTDLEEDRPGEAAVLRSDLHVRKAALQVHSRACNTQRHARQHARSGTDPSTTSTQPGTPLA